MKHFCYILLLFCVTSCSSYQLPPFAGPDKWYLRNGAALNLVDSTKIDFSAKGNALLCNASNGEYDLNFILNRENFDNYSPDYTQYLKDIIKTIPLKIDSIELILADQYLVLSISEANNLIPDYIRRADGAIVTVQACPVVDKVQPDDELWRNLLFDNKKCQLLVVDRIIKKGHHYAIVYVLQGEKKGIPNMTPFHFDILDKRNMQSVGTHLEYLMNISVDAITSSVK